MTAPERAIELPLEQQFKDAFRVTGLVTNTQAWELSDAAMKVYRADRAAAESAIQELRDDRDSWMQQAMSRTEDAVRFADRAASVSASVVIPDSYELFALKNFPDLSEALHRADRKGYLPHFLEDEWAAFQYERIAATSLPSEPRAATAVASGAEIERSIAAALRQHGLALLKTASGYEVDARGPATASIEPSGSPAPAAASPEVKALMEEAKRLFRNAVHVSAHDAIHDRQHGRLAKITSATRAMDTAIDALGAAASTTPAAASPEEPLSANKVIDSFVNALREIEWSNDTRWQSQRARDVLWDNHYMPAKERPTEIPGTTASPDVAKMVERALSIARGYVGKYGFEAERATIDAAIDALGAAATQAKASVSAEWVSVPREPTEAMWTAGRDPVMHRDLGHKPALFSSEKGECPAWQINPATGKPEMDTSKGTTAVHVWRAMLAAAPQPPKD